METHRKFVNILGVKVDQLESYQLLERIKQVILTNQKELILNSNVQMINLAFGNREIRQILDQADLVFCDGEGVKLAAHILGFQIPQRITYADWMWKLAELCAENNFTMYFLGAKPEVAERASKQLKSKFPKLRIVGTQNGYFNKIKGVSENELVISKINEVTPDILIVGFGMPLQEHWLMENWEAIDAHVFLTGGAVFDYISGELNRAPRWMTDHGLEWLGRLIIEPRRLWKRYLIGIPLFFWRVLLQKFGLKHFPIDPPPPPAQQP